MAKLERKNEKNEGGSDFLLPESVKNRVDIDYRKIEGINAGISEAISNYLIFQKNPGFRWPHWVIDSLDGNSDSFEPLSSPLLMNSGHRDWMRFTNLLSSEALYLDRKGMISVSYDSWSIEIWLKCNSQIYRPQQDGDIVQNRDTVTTVAKTIWKHRDFELVQSVYGCRSSIDESLLGIDCSLKKSGASGRLYVMIRPYSLTDLGKVHRIEYRKENGIIRINNTDRVHCDHAAAEIFTGNAAMGDVDFAAGTKNTGMISCPEGLATLGLEFPLKKGDNKIHLRISLSAQKNLSPGKSNYSRIKEDFDAFGSMRTGRGFKLTFPDKRIQRWSYGTKGTILGHLHGNAALNKDGLSAESMKEFYHITAACNRMGYFPDSEKMLSTLINSYNPVPPMPLDKIVALSYFIITFADYFLHSREMDFLHKNFISLQKIAQHVFEFSRSVKSLDSGSYRNINSIQCNFLGSYHPYDYTVLFCCLKQYAYLARCIGIFGEELKFNKEIERLGHVINKDIRRRLQLHVSDEEDNGEDSEKTSVSEISARRRSGKKKEIHEKSLPVDDFYGYLLYAGFPFHCDFVNKGEIRALLKCADDYYGSIPLYLKSLGGWDTVLSLVYATNQLINRNRSYFSILDSIINLAEDRFSLPDYMNPKTGSGVRGNGDSPSAASMMFMLIRSMLYIDFDYRLDILPFPMEDWFKPGSEIVVEDAPSRFGPINFRVYSTSNEVNIKFTDLPKFSPPEIRISLPFRAKIKGDTDFFIKKNMGNSYIINGWPSVVRFIR